MKNIKFLAIPLAAFSLYSHAATVVQSQVSLTNLNYELVDLRQTDSITPSIVSMPLQYEENYQNMMARKDGDYNPPTSYLPITLFSDVSVRVQSDDGTVQAIRDGLDQRGSLSIDQSVFENQGMGAVYPLPYSNDLSNQFSIINQSYWEISPYTSLTISGLFSIDQSMDGELLTNLPGLQSNNDAAVKSSIYSYASIGVYYKPDGLDYEISADFDKLEMTSGQIIKSFGVADYVEGSGGVVEKEFILNFVNDGPDSMRFRIFTGMGSSSYAISVNSVVPEPSTYALMLLGLGGLAAAVRRQQRWATKH